MSVPTLIDTHCHLNFRNYDDDRAAVLQRARAAGVARIIIPTIDLETCQQALDLAAADDGIYVAVGIHPNSSVDFDCSTLERLRHFASGERVVAIGEIGLDYYWDRSPKDLQRAALERQLELAAELELPVIIHNREADDDVMALLESWARSAPAGLQGRLGVLHSFFAGRQIAERAIELGFYLGFTGPITYKKRRDLQETVRQIPLSRLLIETDGPFLAPQQRRGKRNEPAFVRYINAQLAELHGISVAEMARQTTLNAERLFGLA